MPIYVYGCPRCDVLLEELRPVELADFPPVECPACHGLCAREMATFNIGGRAVERPTPVAAGVAGGAAVEREPVRFEVGDDGDPGFDRSLQLAHGPTCPCCFGRSAS